MIYTSTINALSATVRLVMYFFLLPAIMWYMERERIKDADSLVICVHWLCFQCGLFIRCKRKIKIGYEKDNSN